MTLFEAYEFMLFVLDKDYNGDILTPAYYNRLLQASNLMYYKLKFGLPEEYQVGRPAPRQAPEITRKLKDDIRQFKTFSTVAIDGNGDGDFPDNYGHTDAVSYDRIVSIDGVSHTYRSPIDELTQSEADDRLGNYTKMPTTKYPILVYTSDGIRVYPTTITVVNLSYYRLPIQPVFDYSIVDDEILVGEDPVEWDWPEDCHMDIVRIMLSDMGVNIGSQLITQYSEMKSQKGV